MDCRSSLTTNVHIVSDVLTIKYIAHFGKGYVNYSPDRPGKHHCTQVVFRVLSVFLLGEDSSANNLLYSLPRTPHLPGLRMSRVPASLDARDRFHLYVRSAPVTSYVVNVNTI